MGEDLNPFEPPKLVGGAKSGPIQLTPFDWAIAIVLGFFAVVLTFFATCFGLAVSVFAFAGDWLIMACLVFSLLFSLACGYLTIRNHVVAKKHPREDEGAAVKRRSFRLSESNGSSERTELGEVLFSCAIGMLSFMLILPSLSILSEKFLEVQGLSFHVTNNARKSVSVFALAASIAIGGFYWFRITKKSDPRVGD